MKTFSEKDPKVLSPTVSHDKTQKTGVTVSAYYRVHPEDRQMFIDAVIPEMQAAAKMKGCIYYAFSQDLIDPSTFHLTEAWENEAAYEYHEQAVSFLQALSIIVKNVRILDRQGVRYKISKMETDDPRGKV